MPDFHVADTNMLVFKKPRRSNVTHNQPNMCHNKPNANPNASRWNIVCIGHVCIGITLGMLISCYLSHLRLRWTANMIEVSGGIQA